MSYRWKPSKTAAKEFATKMKEIDDYCSNHGITRSRSSDSYYFIHNGVEYRISNHAVERSVNSYGNNYHGDSDEYRNNVFCIHASKTRLIDIHQLIIKGIKIDHRGNKI